MRRWIKNIFAINHIFDFSLHVCRAVSTGKANRINVDKTILRGSRKKKKLFQVL